LIVIKQKSGISFRAISREAVEPSAYSIFFVNKKPNTTQVETSGGEGQYVGDSGGQRSAFLPIITFCILNIKAGGIYKIFTTVL
jgi:hypothetical protein